MALVWGLAGEAQAAIEAFGPTARASSLNDPPAGASGFDIKARSASERKKTGVVPVVLVPERTGWQGDCFRQARIRGGARRPLLRSSAWRDCRRAAAFAAASPAVRRELEAAGYPRERIRDVPPGAPLLPPRTRSTRNDARDMLADANAALRLEAASPLVISTTRLAADRGWQCLLTAWSIVARRKPAVRLWLAGEAPQAAAVIRRVRELGLAASVALVGTFDDVAELLPAADLHVSPAPEGGVQPVIEAMAAGLPCVAADVPDNRWLLGDREAGLLFPADDAAALAAAIAELLDDTATAQRMGSAAWHRAQAEFSLAGMAEAFCRVLEEVAANRVG